MAKSHNSGDGTTATMAPSTAPTANNAKGKPAPAPKKAQPRAKRAILPTAISSQKKRKPKPMQEKSTKTFTTETAQTPVNVYDAVLGEAQDLLQAAQEAQALGRLKMAAAYQLLLHARLVGLGKRFDRAQVQPSPEAASTDASSSGSPTDVATAPSPAPETPSPPNAKKLQTELSKILPDLEMDQAMMEHLARAAMELHHQRTGRRIQSDTLSPPPPTTTTLPASIAWTEQERSLVQQCLEKGLKEPSEIAAVVATRNESQIKAYLRTHQELKKGSAQMEQEMDFQSPRKRGGRGRKPPTQAMNTVPNAKLDAKTLLQGKGL